MQYSGKFFSFLAVVVASACFAGSAFADDLQAPTQPPGDLQFNDGSQNGGQGKHRHRHGRKAGKGKGDPAQKAARRQMIMQRFDANSDGKLDDNEKSQLQSFRQERQERRAKRQQRQMRKQQQSSAPALQT